MVTNTIITCKQRAGLQRLQLLAHRYATVMLRSPLPCHHMMQTIAVSCPSRPAPPFHPSHTGPGPASLTLCCVEPTAVVTPAANTPAALLVVSPRAPMVFMPPSATCSANKRRDRKATHGSVHTSAHTSAHQQTGNQTGRRATHRSAPCAG